MAKLRSRSKNLTQAGLLAVASMLVLQAQAGSKSCRGNELLWPNIVGGAGNEDVRCFAYDSKNQFVIVGGKSSGSAGYGDDAKSFDFAPTSEDHGYLFALDTSMGDWQWGNFFYNVSYPIQSIDGCQMSTYGDSLAVTGLS